MGTPAQEPPGLMALSAGGALDVQDTIQRSQMLRNEAASFPKTQAVFIVFEANSEDKALLRIPYPDLFHQGSVVKAHVTHRRYRLNSLFYPCSPRNCSSRLLAGWSPQ